MTEVLRAPIYGASYFHSDPTRSSSHPELPTLSKTILYTERQNKPSYIHTDLISEYDGTVPSTAPSSPQLTHSTTSRRPSYSSTPASSVSLDTRLDGEDEEISFPSFEGPISTKSDAVRNLESIVEDEPPSQNETPAHEDSLELPGETHDDHAAEREPTRHVDYLSHEWKEEDIWSSWRYIVARRKQIPNSTRLENASWRTWVKAKNNLRTISPEALNWLKDCDVTWLYGPLQTDTRRKFRTSPSPPPSQLSRSSSFVHKKPILKRKSASAVMLEKSISKHSLLKQAGALLKAQQSSPAIRPAFGRGPSDFSSTSASESSAANTPAEHDTFGPNPMRQSLTWADFHSTAESKHVEFNPTVRQVQAIESDDEDKETIVTAPLEEVFSDDEDDDGGLMMRPPISKTSRRGTPRGSFSIQDCKTIADLPSTTLKFRTDTPEPPGASCSQDRDHSASWSAGKRLSPSPSQETLRPSRPQQNFLIDDNDLEDPDTNSWQMGSANTPVGTPYPYEEEPGPGMRRTASGMFMPYDEHEAEANVNINIFKQAISVANTIKDITYVVWNAGWNKKGPNVK